MRPWLLAQTVAQIEFESAGLDADNGVDAWFVRRAAATKPVVSLETLEEQIQLFATLPDALQEKLLRDMLDETDAFLETTHAILRAWERGDEATLLELLIGAPDDPELAEFHRLVFVERNHRMSERLEALARDGRARFAVIGTGHLIGPESVPSLLEARGFRVRRVPDAFVRSAPEEMPMPAEQGGPVPAEPDAAAPGAAPPPTEAPEATGVPEETGVPEAAPPAGDPTPPPAP
jgi:hypothetical protein